MTTGIARKQTPEELELEKKKSELSALEAELSQRELELATVQADLHTTEAFLHMIKDAYKDKREVVATCAGNFQTLMQDAQGKQFNVCIVVLNNLPGLPRRESADGQAAFVTTLKEACRCPVIALAGWPDDVSLGEKVVRAGASYFFRLPFPVPEFMEAVKACLPAEMGRGEEPMIERAPEIRHRVIPNHGL